MKRLYISIKSNIMEKRKRSIFKKDAYSTSVLQVATVFLFVLEICDALISIYFYLIPKLLSYCLMIAFCIVGTIYVISQKGKKRLFVNLLPAVIYAIYCFVKVLLGGNFTDDFWNPFQLIVRAVSLILCVIMVQVAIYLPTNWKKVVLKLFLVLGTVTVIPSLIYVQSFSDAVRDGYGGFGNINFGYIYATIPLLLMSLFVLKTKSSKNRAWILIYFVFNFTIITLSNFATAFVSMIIGLVFILLYDYKVKLKRLILILLLCAVAVFILREQIANLCYIIADTDFFSPIMHKRIVAIGDFLVGHGGGSSFENRFVLMNISWKSFLKYPIFGIPASEFGEGTVGLHETWMTQLGTTGLVGTGLLLITFTLLIKNVFAVMKTPQCKAAYKFILFFCVILGFLNPLAMRDVFIALFVIIPLYDTFITTKNLHDRKEIKHDKFNCGGIQCQTVSR